jgi:8-oxo-dGTP pyrophosphatase MutT (NUDIX family)
MVDPGESDFEAAVREIREELGVDVDGEFAALGGYRPRSGKMASAWPTRNSSSTTSRV